VGGLVLKHIFGTATVTDIRSIHEVVDELRQRNSDIAHSVSNQLTYVKDLGKINAEEIASLYSVVKDQMIRSHEQILSIAKDMFWLNATLQAENSMFTVIRHLEFTVMQLIQQIDELFDTVQYAILGKMPIKLVNPLELQNILRNVTLQLPESYELVAGSSKENMHLYYELTKVSVVANVPSVSLVLTIPLKTTDSHFTLFRLIDLPTQISPDKFAKYSVDYAFFALQHSRRSYLLLTEADYSRCDKGSITICPAESAVYSSQSLKCESSLFFQTDNANRLCRQKLIFQHRTPFLQRYGELWVYHFPEQQQILRCAQDNRQVLRTLSLTGNGLLHNATGCSITSDAFQIFPELHGTTQTKMDAAILHLPDNITVITDFKLQQLIDIPPLEIQKLRDIHERVTASLQTSDVESLLHTRQTSLLQEKRTNYLITITTSLCAFIIFRILCFILYSHSRYGRNCVCKTDEATSNSKNHPEPGSAEGETEEQKVLFASYSLQPTS